MVDVSAKAETQRFAIAGARVQMAAETLALALSGNARKGDVLGVARIAGIMAAKRTSDLIPLCHPLLLTSVSVDIVPDEALPGPIVTARVSVSGQTGVEMEALHRRQRRLSDDLRHAEGRRPRHDHRKCPPARKERRQVGGFHAWCAG